jgi:hypothetical protein
MSLLHWSTEVTAIIFGFAIWILAEYLVHRFLYHRVYFFHRLHDAHQASPNDLIGGPPLLAIILILLFMMVPTVTIDRTFGEAATFGCLAVILPS